MGKQAHFLQWKWKKVARTHLAGNIQPGQVEKMSEVARHNW